MLFGSFWKKSKVNRLIIIVTFLWILLAIIFGVYDLSISKFLFNADDSAGKLVQAFGEVPGLLFMVFSLFVLNINAKIRNKNYKKLFFIFEILLSSFLLTYILRLFFNYFEVYFAFRSLEGVSVFLGFSLISLLGFYLFKTKLSRFSEKNYLFSKLNVILFAVSGIIVEALKLLWGRVRFADLNAGLLNFTSWYSPNFSLGGSSFPSGHAYLAWILIPLFLVFSVKKKALKWAAIVLTTLFSLFVSYERIVIGAHYASDVLFSAGIVLLTFFILYKKNFDKKKNLSTGKFKKRKNRG
ncbi:MAG: phosphatase PAP2 family protein [archaeon]|nr:phosphatase PAP2 family protein [archaeon]